MYTYACMYYIVYLKILASSCKHSKNQAIFSLILNSSDLHKHFHLQFNLQKSFRNHSLPRLLFSNNYCYNRQYTQLQWLHSTQSSPHSFHLDSTSFEQLTLSQLIVLNAVYEYDLQTIGERLSSGSPKKIDLDSFV